MEWCYYNPLKYTIMIIMYFGHYNVF
ncbi:hypothetical protein WG66_012541, partial [Moniliophthora roreri]